MRGAGVYPSQEESGGFADVFRKRFSKKMRPCQLGCVAARSTHVLCENTRRGVPCVCAFLNGAARARAFECQKRWGAPKHCVGGSLGRPDQCRRRSPPPPWGARFGVVHAGLAFRRGRTAVHSFPGRSGAACTPACVRMGCTCDERRESDRGGQSVSRCISATSTETKAASSSGQDVGPVSIGVRGRLGTPSGAASFSLRCCFRALAACHALRLITLCAARSLVARSNCCERGR